MGYYVTLLCAYVILFKSELIYLHPQIHIISGWWKYSVSFVLAILKYKLFAICGNFPMQLNTVTISFFRFYLFIYSIYMCFAYMFVSLRCTCLVPVEATRECWTIHYELSCGFWDSNPGTLREKPDLLNTESSLWHQNNLFHLIVLHHVNHVFFTCVSIFFPESQNHFSTLSILFFFFKVLHLSDIMCVFFLYLTDFT